MNAEKVWMMVCWLSLVDRGLFVGMGRYVQASTKSTRPNLVSGILNRDTVPFDVCCRPSFPTESRIFGAMSDSAHMYE